MGILVLIFFKKNNIEEGRVGCSSKPAPPLQVALQAQPDPAVQPTGSSADLEPGLIKF